MRQLTLKTDTSGLIFIIIYVLICSIREIYFSKFLRSIPLAFLLFSTFGISTLLFLSLQLSNLPKLIGNLKLHWRDFLIINLTTAFMWAAFLTALKWIQPAAAASLNAAMGPVISVLLASNMLNRQETYRSDRVAAFGVIFFACYLVWALIRENNLNSEGEYLLIIMGILCAIASGTITAVNNLYAKRLSNAGVSSKEIMAMRFIFLIAVSGTFSFFDSTRLDLTVPLFFQILTISFAGMIIPIYFLQLGIARAPINSVALLMAIGPIITFILQKKLRGIPVSYNALAGISGITIAVIFGIVLRIKRSKNL